MAFPFEKKGFSRLKQGIHSLRRTESNTEAAFATLGDCFHLRGPRASSRFPQFKGLTRATPLGGSQGQVPGRSAQRPAQRCAVRLPRHFLTPGSKAGGARSGAAPPSLVPAKALPPPSATPRLG